MDTRSIPHRITRRRLDTADEIVETLVADLLRDYPELTREEALMVLREGGLRVRPEGAA
jgi:hypothetical protein